MALKDDLASAVSQIFSSTWTIRDGNTVPSPERIGLGNDAIKVAATVLYADMADSTGLVDQYPAEFAAEIYKAYLHCAAKLIKARGGTITAYDGDRIMAVFMGSTKNTSAIQAALQLNWVRVNVLNPALKRQYPEVDYSIEHTVGIDTSTLFVAREGVRGDNDLVWVGTAANHAAKLTTLSSEWPTWITEEVHDAAQEKARTYQGLAIWEPRRWTAMDDRRIYRSTWTWEP